MGRPLRVDVGGYVYHVLNRANAGVSLFDRDGDYVAFERVLAQAVERMPDVCLLAYCVMPSHWHLVVCPTRDGELSRFVGWLTLTHTQRWHAHRKNVGGGHVYQGRFKSFVVQADSHLLAVLRYVERNAVRAGLVRQAQRWQWGSLWRREFGDADAQAMLSDWPIRRPGQWVRRVNQPETEAELVALRQAAARGRPYGSSQWQQRMIDRFGLASTLRPRGRPRKGS